MSVFLEWHSRDRITNRMIEQSKSMEKERQHEFFIGKFMNVV
jgi:hypothetical protein